MDKYKFSKYNIVIKEDESGFLIWNSFNGAIIKLEKDIFEKLNNQEFANDVEFFDELFQNGFIVKADADEFAEVVKREQETVNKHKESASFVIAPTLKCNYRCKYCFEAGKEKCAVMNTDTADKIVDYFLSLIDNTKIKNLVITWFGGEPMICYDIICYIGEKVKKLAEEKNITFQSRMITNGSLLDEDKANNLIEKANLKYIQITIDGLEDTYVEMKGTTKECYQKVINNVCCLCDKLKINIRLNADKNNYDDVKNVADFLLEEKKLANKITVHFAEIKNYNKDPGEQFYSIDEASVAKHNFYENLHERNLMKKQKSGIISFDPLFCGFKNKNNFVIGPLGELYKCEHHIGDLTKTIGNVTEGITNQTLLNEFYFPKKNEKCINCNLYPICRYINCIELSKMVVFNEENCNLHDELIKSIKFQCQNYLEESSNNKQ